MPGIRFFFRKNKTEWRVHFVYLDTNKTFAEHYVQSEKSKDKLRKISKAF